MGIQVNRRDLFAIRIVDRIAQADGPVGGKELMELLGIGEEYLNQTTHPLVKAGVLAGKKGPGGGYILGKPVEEITGEDIAKALPRGLCPDDQEDDKEILALRKTVREVLGAGLRKIRFTRKGLVIR